MLTQKWILFCENLTLRRKFFGIYVTEKEFSELIGSLLAVAIPYSSLRSEHR